MLVFMQMLVPVHEFLVPVGVFMDKVSPEEKIRVRKVLFRLAIGDEAMFGTQDKHPARHFLHCIQVLSAENQALAAMRPVYQEID